MILQRRRVALRLESAGDMCRIAASCAYISTLPCVVAAAFAYPTRPARQPRPHAVCVLNRIEPPAPHRRCPTRSFPASSSARCQEAPVSSPLRWVQTRAARPSRSTAGYCTSRRYHAWPANATIQGTCAAVAWDRAPERCARSSQPFRRWHATTAPGMRAPRPSLFVQAVRMSDGARTHIAQLGRSTADRLARHAWDKCPNPLRLGAARTTCAVGLYGAILQWPATLLPGTPSQGVKLRRRARAPRSVQSLRCARVCADRVCVASPRAWCPRLSRPSGGDCASSAAAARVGPRPTADQLDPLLPASSDHPRGAVQWRSLTIPHAGATGAGGIVVPVRRECCMFPANARASRACRPPVGLVHGS